MAGSADHKLFERHSYLKLKTSRPKPENTHEKITVVWMNFGNKLLSSLLMLAILLFFQVPMLQTDTGKQK